MSKDALKLAAALLLASVGVASADVTMVSCEGVVVSISDDVATIGEQKATTMVEFEKTVCALAQQLPLASYEGADPRGHSDRALWHTNHGRGLPAGICQGQLILATLIWR